MTAPPETFVPLTMAGPSQTSREEFRVLIAPSPEKARSLREFNSAASSELGHQSHGEPRVILQREGDTIVGIQIHCSCGQIIDLKCAYADGAPLQVGG